MGSWKYEFTEFQDSRLTTRMSEKIMRRALLNHKQITFTGMSSFIVYNVE